MNRCTCLLSTYTLGSYYYQCTKHGTFIWKSEYYEEMAMNFDEQKARVEEIDVQIQALEDEKVGIKSAMIESAKAKIQESDPLMYDILFGNG